MRLWYEVCKCCSIFGVTRCVVSVPRFTILSHDHPVLHWDLLLELDEQGPLATWRILDDPGHGSPWRAEPLPDHRRIYLDYEGPVSGDRGTVTRWDTGVYQADPERAVTDCGGVITCTGSRWNGRIELVPGKPHWTIHLLTD
jgi:hypothetical protein